MGDPESEPKTASAAEASSAFATTHWSLVLAAGRHDSPPATEALEKLCQAYWHPLYAYIRRAGRPPADAEDLTQGFFENLLRRNDLESVAPEKGRFRTFLLAALKHWLANERDRDRAWKRGGRHQLLSLDAEPAESRYELEPAEPETPEVLFERRWAYTLLERAVDRLRQEYTAAEKAGLFEELKGFLSEKSATARAQIAMQHGISLNAVDVAIHRLRRRYAELIREEIGHTVSHPGDIEEELQHLIATVAQGPPIP